ncbi:MAG: M36 family metallopeptidase, partial [Dokdonella sp.]
MNAFASGSTRSMAVFAMVFLATTGASALAKVHPNERLLDARVNARDAYLHATAARPAATSAGYTRAKAQAARGVEAAAARHQQLPNLDVVFSNLTGAPTSVNNRSGALTPAAPGHSSEQIVRDYLTSNAELFGLSSADLADLHALGDSAGGSSGLRMLRLEQRIDGRPIFQSETRFLIDRQGRLVKLVGQLVPNARAAAPSFDASGLISAPTAIVRLLASAGKSASASAFTATGTDAEGRTTLSENDDYVAGDITARPVLFPLSPGLLVPAWSLVVFTGEDADWYAIVDAQTGDVLWRKNIRDNASAHDARFRVYVQADGVTPADSPAPQSPNTVAPGAGTQFPEIAPTIVSMHTAYNPVASPNGWINDCPGGVCTANETQTLGNNVLACLDRTTGGANTNVCDTDANSVLDGNGRPTGNPDANARNRDFLGTAPRDFQTNFLPPPQGGNPEAGQTATGTGAALDQFRRGATTNIFYGTNWYHDKLYALGFDEASGNFQQINFSGMGMGGDRVLVDVQDGTSTNNANFATPPDGTSGRMQMYRFTGPTIVRDGDLDAEIYMHEATHGVSNRLIGNGAGLNWSPAGGLGEGWSDFVALSLLNNTNADNPNGRYASGAYATYKFTSATYLDNYVYGIRRFPYSTDNSVNPMTWADVDDVTNNLSGGISPTPLAFFNDNGGMEVHNSGEIWALTLWEVRGRVIADPAGANGDVPTGNQTMLQLVIDGMKMTPIDPTFTAARDALFDADCATNACANEASIWGGFADRGLGYGAAATFNVVFGFTAGHLGVHESFSTPYLDVANTGTDVAINDSVGNNNGVIDPGEPVNLTVTLTNPWRAASKAVTGATATLTTSTPGIMITDGSSTYGAIAPQGTAAGDSFSISAGSGVSCGSAIDFTLTTISNLGTTSTTFTLRVGAANGTDPTVTYTRSISPALAIPDARPRAVFDQQTVTDDFVIADLDLRVDSVTHTFTGDLTAMLRSPRGIGVDSMALIGALTDGGSGDNIVNMVMDDEQPFDAAHDMAQVFSASAPYTASWLPVFNAPWPPLAGFPSADPVGTFTRYDGSSTKGTWSLAMSDQFQVDTGTLNGWSMLVTPVHFDCTPFVATANVSGTKTVSGSFVPSGSIIYTIVLTNNGTAAQADNPGNEFTDVLPSDLTLVSATATSGTASTAGNTATWNGSLPALGGTVTITINATISATPSSTTISNQGTISYDADGNGTNESTAVTDDPGVGGATDPTVFTVAQGSLLIAPTTVPFGNQGVNTTSGPSVVTLSNTGTASLDVTALTAASAPFSRVGGNCSGSLPITIAAGSNCTLSYQFAPTVAGPANQVLTVTANAPGSGTIALSGTGIQGALTISPTTVPFGNQGVNTTSGPQDVILSNTGTASLDVTALTAASAPFSRVGGTCSGSLPITIAASSRCTLSYQFAPTVAGAA